MNSNAIRILYALQQSSNLFKKMLISLNMEQRSRTHFIKKHNCSDLCLEMCMSLLITGAWGSVVVKALRYWSDGFGIVFPVVSLGIFSVATDRTMCPGVDSASKNEYQRFILG